MIKFDRKSEFGLGLYLEQLNNITSEPHKYKIVVIITLNLINKESIKSVINIRSKFQMNNAVNLENTMTTFTSSHYYVNHSSKEEISLWKAKKKDTRRKSNY